MPVRLRVPAGTATAAVVMALLAGQPAAALPARADTSARAAYHPWAGLIFRHLQDPYVPARHSDTIDAIEADISIPCLPDTAPAGTYYAWIGLGGVYQRSMIRAGVAARLTRDGGRVQKSYFAWAESWTARGFVASLRPRIPAENARVTASNWNSADTICRNSVPVLVSSEGWVRFGGDTMTGRNIPALRRVTRSFTTAEFVLQDAPGAPMLAASGAVGMGSARLIRGVHTFGIGELACLPDKPNRCRKWQPRGVGVVGPTEDAPAQLCFVPPAPPPPPSYPGDLFPGGDARAQPNRPC
jgi:hypothetical protein